MIKRSIEDTSIVFIGAGNLATNLAHAFYRKGFRVVQIYSRTEESARTLAQAVEADYTTSLASVVPDAQLYIVSLKDDALIELLPQIVAGKGKGLWVHTAGSIPMDIWKGHVERYGVFYPLQTFSKSRLVDFHEIPVFVEGSSDEEVHFLKQIASALSRKVLEANSEQRRNLHLAAVFTCNFTNQIGLEYDSRYASQQCRDKQCDDGRHLSCYQNTCNDRHQQEPWCDIEFSRQSRSEDLHLLRTAAVIVCQSHDGKKQE